MHYLRNKAFLCKNQSALCKYSYLIIISDFFNYIVVQKNGEIGNSSSLFTLEFYSRLLQVVSDILGSSITFLITSRKSKTIKVNNSIKIYNNYIKEYLGAN